ncbi:glucose-6-phosphate 1-epimerase [[Candida] jaroonii]|uniref:Glucose-6-phosphate 1-epimerase n=1 Tax=[Candida] jaroonii TaxID=467808 RepID=A0ACA9Y2V9_9ASCO|nr:glucose-6-phosphate 1-epimerase [[Candida] jaroonii]
MIEEHQDKVIVQLDSDPTTSVTILKYGATVISWKLKGEEQLWVSTAAKLDGSKPVRGGIPLVFPNFGKTKDESKATYDLPQHGFARNSEWEFLGQTTSNPITVQFALSPEIANKEVYDLWKGKPDFTLIYNITLADEKLTTTIEVENPGDKPFEFNWLFHTYFRVDDITDIVVNNLTDEECYDQLLATTYREKAPMVNFIEEFDRIYKKIPEEKVLQIIKLGHVQQNIKRSGLPDAVVWNPWINKSKGMGDFEPKSGYLNMLCIEAGLVGEFKTLSPGEKWTGSQDFYPKGEILVQSNIY